MLLQYSCIDGFYIEVMKDFDINETNGGKVVVCTIAMLAIGDRR